MKTNTPYPKVPIKSCITFNNPHPKGGDFFCPKNSRDPGSGRIKSAIYNTELTYYNCPVKSRGGSQMKSNVTKKIIKNKFGKKKLMLYFCIVKQTTYNMSTEKRIENYLIEVIQDESPESPREWDNLGTMICFHGRYNLGDKHDYRSGDYSGWDEQRKDIEKNENVCVILPLYLYDHSGITMKTSPFGCNWDSGQVGWIVVSKENVRKEFGVKRITKEIIEKVTNILEGEVKTYDQYLTGEIYGYKIYKVTECELGHEHKEELDSCWGFYGEEECMTEGEGIVDYYLTKVLVQEEMDK